MDDLGEGRNPGREGGRLGGGRSKRTRRRATKSPSIKETFCIRTARVPYVDGGPLDRPGPAQYTLRSPSFDPRRCSLPLHEADLYQRTNRLRP